MSLAKLTHDIPRRHAHNLRTVRRQPWAELSGALGDLGTLLPLMISLAQHDSISLSSTLVFSGLFNILTGAVFGIPLPVQPMKAIAAEAISRGYERGMVTAAGGWVSLAVLVLAATGGLRWMGGVVPTPVVRGIQIGAGLQLVGYSSGVVGGGREEWEMWVFAGLGVVLVAVFVLGTTRRRGGGGGKAVPFALVMFIGGVVWAMTHVKKEDRPGWAPWTPGVQIPAWLGVEGRSYTGLEVLGMAVGQLPLTTLNSVVAVSALAGDLVPEMKVTVTGLGFSVAGMNLVGCWFGAMPMCHGAGGLAAQWRFGARSGASVICLGVLKLGLGLVFGDSLVSVIDKFPGAVLGVMVLGAGLELTRVARVLDEQERAERWMVMLVTMAGIVAFRNDAMGFAGGMVCHWFYRLAAWWEGRRQGEVHL
ncbi:sulfate transporter [Coniochaeta sp. 2T2.1]|nr:sulfate transporter [Coniochaeta sp. 2T2.1]